MRALERCKKEAGYWVAGASEHAEQTRVGRAARGPPRARDGLGGQGLARLTRETCDFLVRLPQAGKVGSLNVAQAATALSLRVGAPQLASGA